ncbi:MAG TPA: DUF1684 domain-containing protein [Rhizomicrobium sp.]|nr:DUF1684 domain-containing protein [Rhizomicrobium sp.]
MRSAILAAGLALLALAAATPEQQWKASLADDNKDWALKPHAILKIQDAAYLADGQSSNLMGNRGRPGSYRWGSGAGVLAASVKDGHPVIVMGGKTYTEAEIAKGIAVDRDIDVVGAPTQVSAGVIGARFFVFNQQNPDAKAFKGVDYFPYDPRYVVQGTFRADPKRPARVFRTSRGTDKQFYRVGEARFTLNGQSFTLPFYADSRDPAQIRTMAAFFTDDLTGKGAYGSGRYVDIDSFGSFPPSNVAIDFNYAYNPNCSRSRFYTCPIATDNLATAVKAGERDPHASHS